MRYTPHKYQLEAIEFLLKNRYAGLFLDMGLGKTSISLFAIKQLAEAGYIKKVLLIAPIRALYTVWPNEIKKWDDFEGLTYHNLHESRLPPRSVKGALIHAINPESALPWLKRGEFFGGDYDLLLIDESAEWKNPSSQRFKAIKKGLGAFSYRWILTGTPSPNGLEDIWSQIYLLDQGKSLGHYITHFRNEFCAPDRSGYSYKVIPHYKGILFNRIAPLVMRMSARDNIDMPDLIINPISVPLPPAAFKIYKAMEKEFLAILNSGEKIASPNAAVAGGRCRQISNGGLYHPDGKAEHIHYEKINALKGIVEDLNGTPLLIFYEFNHDEERIQEALGGVPNLTRTKTPDELIKRFNEGTIPVLIGHPRTVGVGLNLQGVCYNILWMCPPWDLYLHDQANARVMRQGQKSSRVVIHYLIGEKTMDSKVLKVLAEKGREQEDLFQAIEAYTKNIPLVGSFPV